ncbi:nuclear transport factor 2 family protein [Streptomyces sp. NPDC006706]|uniref:nuclear transport factor 2 family protein n=1 Tax=Streptomyces sp. NPDC006706 TaxID=3364761 RepID=UPI0036999728
MNEMTTALPLIIQRYFDAADRHDWKALAECFTQDAVAHDDGKTYTGRQEIHRWREEDATTYTYTTRIISVEQTAPGPIHALLRLEGDFPGGTVDLHHHFTLHDGSIEELTITP